MTNVKVVQTKFSYFFMKMYVGDTHWNCLSDAILMSAHNILWLEAEKYKNIQSDIWSYVFWYLSMTHRSR